MRLSKAEDGTWSLLLESDTDRETQEKSRGPYLEALLRYVTAFDLAFAKAKDRSEFGFILTLLRVRGLQDGGWDPYESSIEAISAMRGVHRNLQYYPAARHLELWIYGHVVEASEPYEILANLIAISQGDTFNTCRFPPQNGRPQLVGRKIDQLEQAAIEAGLPSVVSPMREIWDRELRNAIFHSDYSVYGEEVRFRKDGYPHVYGHDEIFALVNRGLAYLDALQFLHTYYVRSYSEPKEIAMHPKNAAIANERAIVMVRQEHGVIGLKHAWTLRELQAGHIFWRIAHYSQEEMRMADADQTRALFPARGNSTNNSDM